MFHQGTLQSGIGLAISEQKLVACFVRDDGPESATWEDEWLQSGWVANLLEQKTVMLRLEAGSTEAGFLSAFCPISSIPTFVVIQNGQLCDQITTGVSKDEFINRVRKVLGATEIPGVSQTSGSTPARVLAPDVAEDSGADDTPAPATARTPAPPRTEHNPVSSVLPPSSKAKGKQKATSPDSAAVTAAQQSARDALRKKKREEKDELARIQARIQADREERKAQDAARKAEREREHAAQSSSPTSSHFPTSTSKKGSQAKDVHLNVRLFDGRTVRSTFPRTARLGADVRPWVDQEFASLAENPREPHPPYIFKQILAPLPSRELSASDESETLGDIDLAPSATLVLVPVKGYTNAYSSTPASGIVGGVVGGVTGLIGGAVGLASSTVGYVGSALGTFIGYGRDTAEEQQNSSRRTRSEPTQDGTGSSSVRVRTLADQRAGETNQEFYNGNQLNFEPNDDDTLRR